MVLNAHKQIALIATAIIAFSTPVFACPDKPISADMTQKYSALSGALDFSAAQKAANELWRIYTMAPDAQAQEWLDEGMSRLRQSDLETARKILGELVAYCPNFAEGYNQLAFAEFLAEEYDQSKANLLRALDLEPMHFGALAGIGLIEQRRGNLPVAKIWIRRAVAVHPFLNERGILDIPDKVDDL